MKRKTVRSSRFYSKSILNTVGKNSEELENFTNTYLILSNEKYILKKSRFLNLYMVQFR